MNSTIILNKSWFNSTAGCYLRAKEQDLYDNAVADLFGFNALQMGSLEMNLLRNSRIPNQYKSTDTNDTANNLHMRCCDDFLPIANSSLDLLLLPHRLDFSERPHQTLREAERVMMPEGHIIISGFNPLSTWGAKSKLVKLCSKHPEFPWSGKYIGLNRMKDWLALMGFEVISIEMCCHVPPVQSESWHQRFSLMDKLGARCCNILGGVYFIVAKKRVVGMMPIKPKWKAISLASTLITRPTESRPSQKQGPKTKLNKKDYD